jgi:hypothetical protein
MKRSLVVMVIALLTGAVSGVSGGALALEQAAQMSDAQQRKIAARVSRIDVKRVVRIEREDGSKVNAILEDVLPDAIVVTILEERTRRRETIPFAEIKGINEVRGHALRNVLIGVGIGVAVLVGTCAASLSSGTPPPSTP